MSFTWIISTDFSLTAFAHSFKFSSSSIEAVSEARAQGDLSENFEYYAAKKDKNKNESRIRYLERM